MAPWLMDLVGSGTRSDWSQKSCVPRPWQSGQAPRWELNEKCLGVRVGSS